jgi:peptidoglycan L-alanyl-D-glutamate endopeptidase CwlK
MRLERLKDYQVTEAISQNAIRLRNTVCRWENLGATYPFKVGDERFVGRVERHFHPVGGPIRPWGPHPGISVLRLVDEPVTARPLQAFMLGARSRKNLVGVHTDLIAVVEHAITHTPIDFTVIEGVRSLQRQRELLNKGASQTLKSRHLTGHAIDLAPWIGGTVSWDWEHFNLLGPTVLQAAEEIGVNVEWGGNWEGFQDGPHFQLPWKEYPA